MDSDASYRYTCWVYRDTNEANFYMGYGTNDVYTLGSTNPSTNPYSFSNQMPPSVGKWYLLVAVIHGNGYDGTTKSGQTGYWDPVTGKMSGSEKTEYRLRADDTASTASFQIRTAQYRY